MANKSAVISLAYSPFFRNMFIKKGMSNSLVRRFVAGEQLRDALVVTKELQAEKILAVIDFLMEDVTNDEDVARAMDQYQEVIRALSTFYAESNVTVKLTSLGLKLSAEKAVENLRVLLADAMNRGGMLIRVDTAGSALVDETLGIVRSLFQEFNNVGAVVQANLRRSDADVANLIADGISVRLVSGNTEESPAVAFTRPQDIDANYRKLLFNLLESGTHVSIATHDVKMIQVAKMFVKQHGIAMEQFEFEMLYGMARELPPKLAKEGYTVRVSVPFGAAWYPYFTDRLADNPDNTGLIGSLFKG